MRGVIPSAVLSRLEEEARARGRPLVEVLLEKLALDPAAKAEGYLELHEKYLKDAEELYAKGDLAQAGEKYWGAVAALLNAIGELLGLDHYSHRDYQLVINRVYRDMGDVDIIRLFRMAEGLHANFYHNFLDRETFDRHREDALTLIEKLRQYIARLKRR